MDFIDEWISAPYPQQRGDREIVLPGLKWIEAEAQKRFGKAFRRASPMRSAPRCPSPIDANPLPNRLFDSASIHSSPGSTIARSARCCGYGALIHSSMNSTTPTFDAAGEISSAGMMRSQSAVASHARCQSA